GPGAEEGEGPGIFGDDPADQGRDLLGHAVVAGEVAVVQHSCPGSMGGVRVHVRSRTGSRRPSFRLTERRRRREPASRPAAPLPLWPCDDMMTKRIKGASKAPDGEGILAEQSSDRPRRRGLRWTDLLLIVPAIAVLWVPFYNSAEPSLGGIPFFYWYLFL